MAGGTVLLCVSQRVSGTVSAAMAAMRRVRVATVLHCAGASTAAGASRASVEQAALLQGGGEAAGVQALALGDGHLDHEHELLDRDALGDGA